MPTAGKVFLYRGQPETTQKLTLEQIQSGLEGYRVSVHHSDIIEIDLITDIVHLSLSVDELKGLFSFDKVDIRNYRGTINAIPYTVEAPFLFVEHEGKIYLIILVKKMIANYTANQLSIILHGEVGAIIEPVLKPSVVEGFYKDAEGTKILLFDGIQIPNMSKATLYGDNVVQTNFYKDFINEGDPWYVVAKTKKRGYTVGLVRDGLVVIFNTVDLEGFIEYVKDEIFPLILSRS